MLALTHGLCIINVLDKFVKEQTSGVQLILKEYGAIETSQGFEMAHFLREE